MNSRKSFGALFHLILMGMIAVVVVQGVINPLSTHLLETSTGVPAMGVAVELRQRPVTGSREWIFISTQYTNANGRADGFLSSDGQWVLGTYKFKFDSAEYYSRTSQPTILPFVEITFDVTDLNKTYHMPVVMGPFGYTTYQGSFFTPPGGTPPPPAPNPITSSLLNTVSAVGAAFVTGHIYRQINDTYWLLLKTTTTTASGQFVNLFDDSCDFVVGIYRLSFETQPYWSGLGFTSIYPTLDVYVNVTDATER